MTGDGKEPWSERVSTVMGRDTTGNWETASRKEWLVTNGLGRFAAGTVAGLPPTAPAWIQQLARAADQFLVSRGNGATAGWSVIAGDPWFADWGRDTMIALPGLTSALGRHAEAAEVLRTFARFVDGGMLPNRFPDAGEAPEYNTVDATLWFFQAIRSAMLCAHDDALAVELYPTLIDIVAHHVAGTRFEIKVDPDDALLRAGVPGMQLTWMDAKVGEWVVTPRVGKPVEVNALWLNALHFTMAVAEKRRDKAGRKLCADLLSRGSVSFERFWNEDAGGLYDVIDVDHVPGNDVSLRPNQLFAVSLPYRPLAMDRMKRIVMVCPRIHLTLRAVALLKPGVWRRFCAAGPIWRHCVSPIWVPHQYRRQAFIRVFSFGFHRTFGATHEMVSSAPHRMARTGRGASHLVGPPVCPSRGRVGVPVERLG